MGLLESLMTDEDLPGRDFKKATFHQVAAIIIGQLERCITLLGREHAELPPIAGAFALTANTPTQIHQAFRREIVRIVGLSASAAANVQILTRHPTTGPLNLAAFAIQATAAGPIPFSEHEFPVPEDTLIFLQADQTISVSITATVFDGMKPQLMMNWEL